MPAVFLHYRDPAGTDWRARYASVEDALAQAAHDLSPEGRRPVESVRDTNGVVVMDLKAIRRKVKEVRS